VSGTRQRWATGRPAATPRHGGTDPDAGQTDLEASEEPGQADLGAGRPDAGSGTDAGRTADAAEAAGPLGQILARSADIAADWAPTAGRMLLGLVFAWFGYHEMVRPGAWTGYVPVLPETSNLAVAAVLIHGWILYMLAVALVAGIAPRAAAALASILMLEIVISLMASGLNDTALRDVGVLGLAVCLTGCRHRRLVLKG
jgi:uncharacterized membrane protein YphA (DoxX/SURF4 family)